jgi:hypothetical protein
MTNLTRPPPGSDDSVLARVLELERNRTPVLWIPEDRSTYVPGHGFRVAIVLAGEDGYRLTGTWPYSGLPGQVMPWFWGHDLARAQEIAAEHNARAGISSHAASLVVARSMARAVAQPARTRRDS